MFGVHRACWRAPLQDLPRLRHRLERLVLDRGLGKPRRVRRGDHVGPRGERGPRCCRGLRRCSGTRGTGARPGPSCRPLPVGTDEATVDENSGPALHDVLANDTDVDEDELTLESVDVDSAEGTATIEDGKIEFTPAADFSGTATVTYVVTDGTETDTGELVITAARNTIETCGSGTKRVSTQAARPTTTTAAVLTR